jgi:hypothetical protein
MLVRFLSFGHALLGVPVEKKLYQDRFNGGRSIKLLLIKILICCTAVSGRLNVNKSWRM